MIRIGTAGIPLSCDGNVTAGVRKVRELGLSAMELEFVRRVFLTEEQAKEVGKVAKELDIELSVHAPYFINLASLEPEKIEASKQRILKSARIGNAAGAKVVVFHPGFYMGRTPQKTCSLIKDAISELRGELDRGGNDILLGLETTGKHKQFGTLDEILEISAGLRGVVPVVDWAHLHARCNGCLKRQEDFAQIFEKVGKTHYHCHLSGIKYSEKGELKHLPVREGDIDYKLLAKEIVEREPDITLISESPNIEGDALMFKKLIK